MEGISSMPPIPPDWAVFWGSQGPTVPLTYRMCVTWVYPSDHLGCQNSCRRNTPPGSGTRDGTWMKCQREMVPSG